VKDRVYRRLTSPKLVQPVLSIVAECRCRLFDWRHHIKTCGTARLSELTIRGEYTPQRDAIYDPTHPKLVFEVLDSLGIDYREYTFVDLGSGKGRTLLIASEYPFQKIIGVEFAEELHRIALKNVHDYRSRTQQSKNIECLLLDATDFIPPPVATVFWMYNPFRPPVLVPVLRNIEKSLSDAPRDVILVYVTPSHAQLIERETRLRQVSQGTYHKLYRFSPVQPLAAEVDSLGGKAPGCPDR